MKIELALPEIARTLAPAAMREAMERAAEDTEEKIKAHYRKLPEDWFDSTETSFPDGTAKHGRGRTFMRALATHWQAEKVGAGGFALAFRATRDGGSPWGLRLQEYGGTITARRAKSLAIPLTAEARGRRPGEYSGAVHPLFRIASKQSGSNGTLVWKDEAGKLHAAYALRKRVEIKPLIKRRRHHGIPTEYQLRRMAAPALREAIKDLLK